MNSLSIQWKLEEAFNTKVRVSGRKEDYIKIYISLPRGEGATEKQMRYIRFLSPYNQADGLWKKDITYWEKDERIPDDVPKIKSITLTPCITKATASKVIDFLVKYPDSKYKIIWNLED